MKKLKSLSKYTIIQEHRKLEKAISKHCYSCNMNQKKIDCGFPQCDLHPHRPWAKKKSESKQKFTEAN